MKEKNLITKNIEKKKTLHASWRNPYAAGR